MARHSTLSSTNLHDPLGSQRVGALTLAANQALSYRWNCAGGALLNVDTTTGTIVVSWGNTTDNPAWSWLGTGAATFGGTAAFAGAVSAPGAGSNSERFGAGSLAAGGHGTALGGTASASASYGIALGYGAVGSIAGGLVVGGAGAAAVTTQVLGAGDTDTGFTGATYRVTNASGANAAGGTLTLQPGLGTGTALAGSLIVNGADPIGSGSTLQTALERFRIDGATGDVHLNRRANGQSLDIPSLTEVVTLTGAAFVDSAIQIPASCIVLAVTSRVLTTITGPAAWKYGVATDTPPLRYGSSLALAAGTTARGLDVAGTPQQFGTAVAIRLQAQDDATAFTGGTVRVTIHYISVAVPTS